MYKSLFAALALVAGTQAASAATFTVNVSTDGADATAGDGICETAAANAQCSLRAAIQEANALAGDDTIQFSVTGTITVTSALPNITQSLFINGPAPAGSVVVDGTASPSNFSLFRYTATGNGDYSISNLTIQNGRAAGAGGGIFFGPTAVSALTLTDVTVRNSQAAGGAGGGIAVTANNELSMTGGAVTGNSSTGNGGGISNVRGTLTLSGVTISGNTAVNGGGIGLSGGTLTLDRSTISGNTTSQDGGGLFLGVELPSSSSSATLTTCTIAGNTAANGGGIGGSATNSTGSSMVHCTVAGNIATAAGGGGGIGVLAAASNANVFFPGTAAKPFTNNLVTDNFIGSTQGPRNDCRQAFDHTGGDSGYNISSVAGCGFTKTGDSQTVGGCTNGLAARLGTTQTRGLSAGCAAAIDTANPAHAISTDQRGAAIADGDKSGQAQRDIGAYEFAAYGAVEFGTAAYSVREDAGQVQTQLRRYGNLAAAGSTNFATNDGCSSCTATATDDFTTTSGTRSWTGGDGVAQDVNVPIVDDTETAEGDETFQINLSNLTQGSDVGANGTATVTIADVENGALQFNNSPPESTSKTVCEADDPPTCTTPTPVGSVTFQVRRVSANTVNEAVSVAVDYTGTAQRGTGASCNFAAGDDYLVSVTPAGSTATQINWGANDTANRTVTITVCNDTGASAEFEPNETATLTLSGPTNGARLGTPVAATATIVSDDAEDPGVLQLSATQYDVAEDVAGGMVTITVTRTDGNDQAVSVDYRTSAGTAQAGSDYSSRSGTLTWAAEDAASKTFTVPIINDGLREPLEQFTVTLSNPNNTDGGTDPTLGTNTSAPVRITSEDKMKFRFTQTSWTAIEGSPVTILVQPFQAVVDGPYTITYSTADGTADSADYTPTSGSLTFNNGETAAKSFTVATTADALVEGNQTFTVSLATANANGEIMAPNPTTVTISEDDTGFQMGAASATIGEGGGTIDVTVKRLGSSTGAVSVNYATADGTAVLVDDYAAASGTLNWADGDSADKTVTLTIAEDAIDEDDETFTFALSSPSAGTQLLSPSSEEITITDNDAAPTLAITSPSVAEGNTGTTGLAFVVTLSGASGKTVTVDFVSANGTATAGSDYTSIGGTLTFVPGDTSETAPVSVIGDTVDEANETLSVTLSNATNAAITTALGTGTITDDDTAPTVSIADAIVTEGNATDVAMSFPVTLSAASGQSVTVNYSTTNGTAVAPGDYTTVTGATLTFAPGETTKNAVVTVRHDALDEQVETLTVTLSNATNVTVTDGTAIGAINDAADDVPPADDGGSWGLLSLWLLLPAWLRRRVTVAAR